MDDQFGFGYRIKRLLMPLAGLCLLAYLGYHAFIGERSISAHQRLTAEAEVLEARLATLEKEKLALEQRISLMSDRSVNKDMLDERVRAVLNFSHPDDITILRDVR